MKKPVIYRTAIALATLCLLATPPFAAQAQQAGGCQFILGFKTLHDMDPGDVGNCIDNQAFAGNGDAQQHTSSGLMAWRKADNWTAFTNGYSTWINGPGGLVHRLNTQRYSWEADYGAPNTTKILDPNGQKLTVAFEANLVLNGAVEADDGSGHVTELQPKGQWVNVYFDVRNNQTKPAPLSSANISLGDKQGRSYVSPFDLRQVTAIGQQETLFSGSVAPGATVMLRLTFDVAKDASGGVLHVPGGNDVAVL